MRHKISFINQSSSLSLALWMHSLILCVHIYYKSQKYTLCILLLEKKTQKTVSAWQLTSQKISNLLLFNWRNVNTFKWAVFQLTLQLKSWLMISQASGFVGQRINNQCARWAILLAGEYQLGINQQQLKCARVHFAARQRASFQANRWSSKMRARSSFICVVVLRLRLCVRWPSVNFN